MSGGTTEDIATCLLDFPWKSRPRASSLDASDWIRAGFFLLTPSTGRTIPHTARLGILCVYKVSSIVKTLLVFLIVQVMIAFYVSWFSWCSRMNIHSTQI